MKLVAPIVTTILLSWILYRKTGTWSPVEVWSKAEYDAEVKGMEPVKQGPQAYPGEDVYAGGQVRFPKSGVGSTFENPITM